MMNLSRLLFAAFLLSSAACMSTPRSLVSALGIIEHVEEKPPPQAPVEYKKALEAIGNEDYVLGLELIEKFIQQNPTSPYEQSAVLNEGRALEGLGRFSEAAAKYHAVIEATAKAAPKLQAMAYYRLSFCTEALGEDQETVVVLNDLQKRKNQLPNEVARAELPARLASAYARVGAFEPALQYYKQAEAGMARLKKSASGKDETPEWMPRTLFYMGARPLTHIGWGDFENAFRPMARSQIYLLEAADFGKNPWSKKAADNLLALYQELYGSLESVPFNPSEDPLIEQRTAQGLQWERAALLLDSLQELVAHQAPAPMDKQTPQSRRILQYAAALKKKLDALLSARPAGEGLTAAALERQNALHGKTLAPDDSLERKFLKSAEATGAATKELPSKKVKPGAKDESTETQDDPTPVEKSEDKGATDPNL